MRWTTRFISRGFSTTIASRSNAVLRLPKVDIFRYGGANRSTALLRDVSWTVLEGENWAIVGSHKTALIEAALSRHRVVPPPPSGVFPFLAKLDPPHDPLTSALLVSFSQRRQTTSGGEFYDFTARYGAVREEDRVTLRKSLSVHPNTGQPIPSDTIEDLAERLELGHLLDLPLVALSNGQTRRARVMKELLQEPEILFLDEPLTGLDVKQRPRLSRLLCDLHAQKSPRIIIGLRPQDPIPEWITHVAVAQDGVVTSGMKDGDHVKTYQAHIRHENPAPLPHTVLKGNPIIEINGLNIAYHGRKVLEDINWTIREGERWQLRGPNGSGKTTLLSVIMGDHPQSWGAPLQLFGRSRKTVATAEIQQKIGFISPELFNAFPRRSGPSGLTVREAIGTGFESTYSYRAMNPDQHDKVNKILDAFQVRPGFDSLLFASLDGGEQSLVLLLRALVNSPPLLILDEVFAGMDDELVARAKWYLREKLDPRQAVVFVTHWEEEVPWAGEQVQRLTLSVPDK